jgi:hypothetical protein
MVFKNGVKNIQAATYKGVRMAHILDYILIATFKITIAKERFFNSVPL